MKEKTPSQSSHNRRDTADESTFMPLPPEEEAMLVREWQHNQNSTAREKLIMANVAPLRAFVNRRFSSWAQSEGVDMDELYGIANEALVKAVDSWDPENNRGSFAAYCKRVAEGEIKRFFGARKADMLSAKERRALWHLADFATQIGKSPETWTDEEIRQFANRYHLSPGVVRVAIAQYGSGLDKVRLDDSAYGEDDESRSTHEHIASDAFVRGGDLSDFEPHGSAPYHTDPENILLHKQERELRKQAEKLDIEWAVEQLREWLRLLPENERLTVIHRYIVPSSLTMRTGAWTQEVPYDSVATKLTATLNRSVTPEEVEKWDKGALLRLQAFARGDFSLVDPQSAEEARTLTELTSLREKAGGDWELWMMLLPTEEKRVLYYRWFYNRKEQDSAGNVNPMRYTPRKFEAFCLKGNKENSTFGISLSEEEARQLEKEAIKHLQEFAQGDFSHAEYRRAAHFIVEGNPQLAQEFLSQFDKKTIEYAVFYYRFISKKRNTLRKGDKIYEATAPALSAGSKKFRERLARVTGDDTYLTDKEKAKQKIEEIEKELAKQFFLFATRQMREAKEK